MQMPQAFFLDFYGTVAYEDDEIIRELSQRVQQAGNGAPVEEIRRFWYETFHACCRRAHGAAFQTQRSIELQTLEATLRRFAAPLDAGALYQILFAQWVRPQLFADTRPFFDACPAPIYIVSNIDQADIQQAIAFHKLKPAGVFTSEHARAYQPWPELFMLALRATGLRPEHILHVGDSRLNDVAGARAAGLDAVWINRAGLAAPDPTIRSVRTLTELLSPGVPGGAAADALHAAGTDLTVCP